MGRCWRSAPTCACARQRCRCCGTRSIRWARYRAGGGSCTWWRATGSSWW
uniref:Uncharacterized protein n=1 Tax=Arundo donax TaxID=35708 RepID=A0A0A9FIU7_ARUDO